ncbi:MAG: hypothetical protein AB1345_09110 [Chloroflexota bacterium]
MTDEKAEEKEAEKREEKSPEEKSWEEKWRRDPLGTLIWGLIFIWAGLVLFADYLGLLDNLMAYMPETGMGVWSWVLGGAGVLILIEVLVRLLMPEYRKPVIGSLVIGVVLIGIGLGGTLGWKLIGPSILIILGLSILLRGFFRKK